MGSNGSAVLDAARAHIAERTKLIATLREERTGLMRRIAEIDSTINILGGSTRGKGRPFRLPEDGPSGKKAQRVIDYLREHPGVTGRQVRDAIGCARNFLHWAASHGYVRSEGAKGAAQRWWAVEQHKGQHE